MLHVALVILVVGVLLWLVTQFIPMNGTVKQILIAFVVICLVLIFCRFSACSPTSICRCRGFISNSTHPNSNP